MPIRVLLVDDSPGDVRLMQETFRSANNSIQLLVASDGAEAMSFLRNEGGYAQAPRPDFILLDLNLPIMDGCQVLAQIKQDASLKSIPTVILSASAREADIARSYTLQANCYLTKPLLFGAFENLVRSINDFWLKDAQLPHEGQAAPPDA